MKEKVTEAGVLYDLNIGDDKYYFLSSKKDSYRGGKVRNVSKTLAVLSGKVTSITQEEESDKEETFYPGSIYSIPANIPHLLHFIEDSVVVEWWDKDYTEEKFEPFYKRKKK